MQSRVVTTDQAGDILSISRSDIYNLMKAGKIKPIENIHPIHVFYVEDLLKYAENIVYKLPEINVSFENDFLIFESEINKWHKS
jgi:hypothetical protein